MVRFMTLALEAEYRALTESVGVADVSDRAFVELTGADRAKFLHNLCSNEILRLTPGQGCEALLLNAKGRVVGHVFVYCSEESLILDSSPGQGEKLLAHLDRYIIREKVELRDRTAEMGQLLLAGPNAPALLENLGCVLPSDRLHHGIAEIAGNTVFLRRSGLTGPDAITVVCPLEKCRAVLLTLEGAGAVRTGAAAVQAARIEAGVPLYGADISEDNLPQEIDRNAQAISFSKGCYLGQETVARIDALGHVNRTLVGLRFTGPKIPEAGCELKSGETPVGRTTSGAWSARQAYPIALGYVRQGHNHPGARLGSSVGEAEVVALPMTGG
jgi:folate-binding protein YgfZ